MKSRKNTFSTGFSAQFAKKKAKYSAKIAKNPAFHPSLLAALSLFLGIFAGTYAIPTNVTFANTKIDAPANNTSTEHSDYLTEKDSVEKSETKSIANRGQGTTGATYSYNSGSTTKSGANYASGAGLSIPSLGISTSVSPSSLSAANDLSVPGNSVSVYGTLLMGHSSGVFANLPGAGIGQEIIYNGKAYAIDNVRINLPVDYENKKVGNYKMGVLINLGSNRIVLMTCAGSYIPGKGYSGRTLVFATLK